MVKHDQANIISIIKTILKARVKKINMIRDRVPSSAEAPSSPSMLSCLVDIIKYPPGRRIRFISNRSLPPEKGRKFNLFF